ncbi:dihydroorotate dehydrogenase [Taxawa tesnikishii (nom. ined.)]|nr:dihydroorotate dehydrogenase [Dothideales sp. JES 119]
MSKRSLMKLPAEVAECYSQILDWQDYGPICMEINLSCPNIPSKPPPAYSRSALLEYFDALQRYGPYRSAQHIPPGRSVPIGIKTPPYTYADQFHSLISALMSVVEREGGAPIDFITATNTLGSCLLLTDSFEPALASASGAGVGGLAGAPLHPLALGNVKTLRTMLDQHETLRTVDIIGIGGVSDRAGFDRMQNVGAKVVGVGTALGREGTDVFRKILTG